MYMYYIWRILEKYVCTRHHASTVDGECPRIGKRAMRWIFDLYNIYAIYMYNLYVCSHAIESAVKFSCIFDTIYINERMILHKGGGIKTVWIRMLTDMITTVILCEFVTNTNCYVGNFNNLYFREIGWFYRYAILTIIINNFDWSANNDRSRHDNRMIFGKLF